MPTVYIKKDVYNVIVKNARIKPEHFINNCLEEAVKELEEEHKRESNE